ncbi:MAG: hypothetical protein JWO30_3294 [Fibrobacteres bacterium]|nr:hypothetical protein [Fibrobacterota bacterium]
MKKSTIPAVLAAVLMAATLTLNTGCRKEGGAEKMGEKLDGTKSNSIHDAVEPDGLGEKAGKKLDKAVDKATD